MARFRCHKCQKEHPRSQAHWRCTDPEDKATYKRYCERCAKRGDKARTEWLCFDEAIVGMRRSARSNGNGGWIFNAKQQARIERLEEQKLKAYNGKLYPIATERDLWHDSRGEAFFQAKAISKWRGRYRDKPKFKNKSIKKKQEREARHEQLQEDAAERQRIKERAIQDLNARESRHDKDEG